MAYVEFSGQLDSPKGGAFVPFTGELDPPANRGPATEDDPLTRVTPSAVADGSVTPVYDEIGGGRGKINPAMPAQAPQTSGSTVEDIARNVRGGLLGGVAGAGAALADAAGANEVASVLDQQRQEYEQDQKENGGDTITGKAASLVGAVAPAFLVPEAKAAQLISNAGLFAIPAFRDTLKAKLDAGQSFPLALAHASEAFGINLFLPTVATRGSGAIVKTLGQAEATGAKGVATALGQAAAEGAGFSAASSALDKGTDVAAGQQNDNDWVNLKDMAASALGFTALRAAHMAPQAASAIADRAGTTSQQFGRALGQDVDAAQFTPAEDAATQAAGVQANPNLAHVDPIAKIAQAGSVDEAIAAAQEAVSSTPVKTPEAPEVPSGPTIEQLLAQTKAKTSGLDQDLLNARPLETEPIAQEAAPEAATQPATTPEAAPTTEPASTWFGRAGDGYKTMGDAQMALPSRLKVAPDLTWQIEPMPNGKFRLAGYEAKERQSADEGAQAQTPEAQTANVSPENRANDANDATAIAQGGAPATTIEAAPAAAESGRLVRDVQAPAAVSSDVRSGAATGVDQAQKPETISAFPEAAPEVSRYNGKYGKGMGRDAARLEAVRLNRQNDGVTYTAEEHGDPNLENPYAVVGRRMGHELPEAREIDTADAERALNDIPRETTASEPPARSIDDVRAKWDAAGIKHSLIEKDGTIEVGRIEVPKDRRNTGIGTEAMRQLADYADATGKRITLSPSADFGGSKSRLTDFYKRFGFVENKGRSRDFTTRDTMIREPREADDFTKSGGVMERIAQQGYEKAEVPRVQAARRLSTLLERYNNNKISDGMFQLELQMLAHRMSDVSATKQANRVFSERERGADLVREKLIRARRQGDLDHGTVEFGLWLLDKNPDLAEGLGASVRSAQGSSAGRYSPAARVITLFKNKANEGTAVHEILHHSERMMPEEVQKGIAVAWSKAFAKAYKDATPEQRAALDKMTESMAGDEAAHKDVIRAFRDGTLEYDQHYQLTNPSEYWAVNATRIMQGRYEAKSWAGKAKQWLGEMIEKAKGAFGLSSDAPIIKGLKAVLEGDGSFQSKKMLSQGDRFSDIKDEDRARLADRLGGSYHAYAGVERIERESNGTIADSIAKAIVPAGRKDASITAGIVRANLGEQAREREVAQQRLMEFAKRFDSMPVEENYKFIDAMERGVPLKDPELSRAAVAIRKVLDERRDQVIALGKGNLEKFNENYFPHIWKDPTAFRNFLSRRPLEGGKGFLNQRTYDYFADGLKAGLEPVTTNPVELAMLKAREMDRYIYGQRIFQEMKDAGVAKFVGFGKKAPDGWQKINDKIARVMQYSEAEKGMILRGEYYAPEQAATLINNHLSPGLSGVAAFDMIRKAGNMMNGAQLGLSAFHLGFTTLDAMISKAALGIKQASRGDVLKGTGNMLQSLNPAQPVMNLIKGDRLLKAYLGNLNDPELAPIVEALVQAGGRVKMDDVYRNAAANEFRQAIRKGNYGTAARKLFPRMLDLINKPIFEYLVPRQKLGVFFDMAKDALEKNPEMSLAEKRQTMGKLWDSVDNRMGELVYDNVFWNRALKDALMVSVRSVGWNLGTFREIGGGVKDLKDIPKLGGLSDRTAYIFALPFMTAIIGSLTQYLMTGEGPRELKDVFFPRTGKVRPDGTEDRLSLPSYMKDIAEYGHDIRNFVKYGEDPFNTLENKMHPLISTLAQIFTNKDFFGGAIRSPGDKPTQQALDEASYMLKQFTPFSLRNYQQQAKLKGEEPSIAGYLSSPSMIGITPAPAYITKNDEQAESSQVNKMREALVTKFREEMRDGADWPEIKQRAMDAGIRGQDLEWIRRSAVQRPAKHTRAFATH